MANKTTFSCGKSLDISEAAALHARLLKSLSKSSTIEIKANQVEKADTAGLQLLVALQKEVLQTGGALIWKQPSATLMESATLLGVNTFLELTESS